MLFECGDDVRRDGNIADAGLGLGVPTTQLPPRVEQLSLETEEGAVFIVVGPSIPTAFSVID
jgi:hypothetical protein